MAPHPCVCVRVAAAQEERVAFLRQQQDQYRACGERIELHMKAVDNAIAVVRSALDSRVDWLELERIVADETAAGNPIASLIVSMDLAHSRITLR